MLALFSILEVLSGAGRLANKSIRINQRRASARLLDLARAHGMAVPAHDALNSDPRFSNDIPFTDAFIERGIQSHLEAISLYEDEAKSPDAQLRAFARRILPQLHRRLAVLRSLKAAKTAANEIQGAREKLRSMIGKHRVAMLTTRVENTLRSRPMTIVNHSADGSLWFFAAADSAAAGELKQHAHVCLSYSDSSKPDFVSVSGDAAIVTDMAKKRALWNTSVQEWFPEGAESTRVVLVEVRPLQAEYWDSAGNKLVQLFGYAKAAAGGRVPLDLGEHSNVPLDHRS
jgi:general stress protein 26